MKRIKKLVFLFFGIIVFAVVSCAAYPQVAEIQIKNNSGKDVTNLIISFPAMDIKSAKIIDRLLPGKSISFKYDYVNDQFTSSRTATCSAEIVYYLGEVKFDMDNGDSEYITLSNGVKITITITDDGWTLISK